MAAMRKWHKYLGLGTTLLVVLVSLTGILLVHKKDLGLNKLTVNLPGYGKPVPPEGWDLVATPEGRTLLASKQGIFATGTDGWRLVLPVAAKRLYQQKGVIYACTVEGLQVTSDGGQSWQKLLADEARGLHLGPTRTVAVTVTGVYQRNDVTGKWDLLAPLPKKGVDVREVLVADDILLAAKDGLYRVHDGKVRPVKLPGDRAVTGIELQKLVTDLHTGAFFGNWFVVVIDLVALSLVFFALSGVWLWYVPWKKKRSVTAA